MSVRQSKENDVLTPEQQDNALPQSVSPSSSSTPYLQEDGSIDWVSALEDNEKWMKSKIARQVGEYAAVDEVFQDVALAAAKQKSPLRDPSKVGAWLNRLVIVQSALYRRTLGRKRKLVQKIEEQVSSPQEFDTDRHDPLAWLLDEERNQRVRDALNQLSADEQQILLMKYSEDKSYQDIAEELDLTVSSVQSKLHRARIRLKKLLRDFMQNQ